jgi:hypothetical protein
MEQQSEIDRARIEALRGNVETALPVLARHAEAGDDGAAASAAELSAYLWRWSDVIAQAARLIANPYAVFAGNVFDELVLLLGRAGHETGDWWGDRWKAVRANWADWIPVDRAQTAPLVFFIDAGLANLVTRDRAIELVHLPRAAYLTT